MFAYSWASAGLHLKASINFFIFSSANILQTSGSASICFILASSSAVGCLGSVLLLTVMSHPALSLVLTPEFCIWDEDNGWWVDWGAVGEPDKEVKWSPVKLKMTKGIHFQSKWNHTNIQIIRRATIVFNSLTTMPCGFISKLDVWREEISEWKMGYGWWGDNKSTLYLPMIGISQQHNFVYGTYQELHRSPWICVAVGDYCATALLPPWDPFQNLKGH